MILRTIELENFGLFAGRQTIDLVPKRDQPVVLFGGKNGAGKTTLLEAVRLALYGRRALGFRVAQSEYEDYLRRRAHIGVDGNSASVASVGLEFDYTEGGLPQRYRVSCHWVIRGSKTIETLTLEKDGQPVDTVPRDEWANFLQELIPPGVSQLFFFDGEKIAEIARDDPDEGLAEAVRGLLGIELVGRLRTDLGLYLARRGKRGNDDAAGLLEGVIRDINVLDKRISEMAEDVAELTTQQASHARVAANVRLRFVSEGGGDAANRRATIEASRHEIREQIMRREQELRELANKLLPFAVAPKLSRRFALKLSGAGEQTSAAQANELRQRFVAWKVSGVPARKAHWDDGHWEDLVGFFTADAKMPDHQTDGSIADLEAGERQRLLDRMTEIREIVPPHAALLVSDLDGLQRRLRDVDAELVRASGHAAGIVLDELLLAEKQLGAAEAATKALAEELRMLEYQRSNLLRERDRILKMQTDAKSGEDRAALARRVGRALQQYEEQLLELKIAQLRTEFVARFNHLARKNGFVADVKIDRTTFDATLIDRTGGQIPKSSLSAGEKQIYAIAMLWALAKTSGRALPMIIDTPLARLDSEHRTALVERYFPEASHQVIVLSTDTEIDDQLLERLRPKISHTYRLDFDARQRATVAVPGYFGTEAEDRYALQQA